MSRARARTYAREATMRRTFSLAALLLAGCLTHLPPPPSHCQMRVRWAKDFDAAQARAVAEQEPIVAVLAAGALDGPC